MFRRFLILMLCLVCMLPGCMAEGGEPDAAEDFDLPENVRGYVLITAGDQMGWLPLPEEEDYDFPIVQTRADGAMLQNLLHVTPDGVSIASATCDNQDCVHQGEVTLDNREERILYNLIICLPNQVMIELLTPEEMLQRLMLESVNGGDPGL